MNWAIVDVDEAANSVKSNVEDVDLAVFRRWGVEVKCMGAGVEDSVAVDVIGSPLIVDEPIVKSLVEKEYDSKESVKWELSDEESVLESCEAES